jgi:hypothetical protein
VIALNDIADIAGCRAVVSIQIEVWGEDGEVVPASVAAGVDQARRDSRWRLRR